MPFFNKKSPTSKESKESSESALLVQKSPSSKSESKAGPKQMSDSELLEYFTTLLFECAGNLMQWEMQNREQRGTPAGKATQIKLRVVNETFGAIKNQINSEEGCSPQQLTNFLIEMVDMHETIRNFNFKTITAAVKGYEPPYGMDFITQEMHDKLAQYVPPAKSPQSTQSKKGRR